MEFAGHYSISLNFIFPSHPTWVPFYNFSLLCFFFSPAPPAFHTLCLGPAFFLFCSLLHLISHDGSIPFLTSHLKIHLNITTSIYTDIIIPYSTDIIKLLTTSQLPLYNLHHNLYLLLKLLTSITNSFIDTFHILFCLTYWTTYYHAFHYFHFTLLLPLHLLTILRPTTYTTTYT